MTTAQDFPFFWNQFKKQMKENPQLNMKFVHNGGEKDEAVQQISGLNIELKWSKVNPHDADFILRPLKILVSSGIFWWWEKWEQIKFHRDRQIWRNSTEFIDESLAEFKPLSFQDSDVHLVFLIWLLFLILPVFAFLLEIMPVSKICSIIWRAYKQQQQRISQNWGKPKVVQNLIATFRSWMSEKKSPNSTNQFKGQRKVEPAAEDILRNIRSLRKLMINDKEGTEFHSAPEKARSQIGPTDADC